MSVHNPIAQILLPILVVVVMFALGSTLTRDDLHRVLRRPRGFFVGVLVHALLLPGLAFVLAFALQLPRELAVGLVLIASAPAAAPASLFTHLARGDTMLCVSLTAAASLTSAVTLPLFMNAALRLFADGATAVHLPILASSLTLFVVCTLPVGAGMLLRQRRPAAARAIEARAGVVGLATVAVAITAVVLSEKDNVLPALARAGGPAFVLNVLAVFLAWAAAALFRLDVRQRIAIALECGLQNFALAAFVALTLLADGALLVPPLAYGLMCYVSAAVVVFLGRRAAARETGRESAEAGPWPAEADGRPELKPGSGRPSRGHGPRGP